MIQKTKSFITKIVSSELHKHPFMVPIVTLIVLSTATVFAIINFGAANYVTTNNYIVQFSDEGVKQVVPSNAATVSEFLQKSKVELKEGDIVEPSKNTTIDQDDFRINIYRAKPVTIVDNGKKIQTLSAATTPRSIAAQAGLSVYAEDDIDYANSNEVLRDQVIGTEVVIKRSVAVNLNLYGTPVTTRTHKSYVRELLEEKNIKLASSDTVTPATDTVISPNIQIFITRAGIKIVTENQRIPNEVKYIDDPTLSFGTQAVRQEGTPGQRVITYQISLLNGGETGRKVIQEVNTQNPVPKIIARGKAISIPADKSAWMSQAGISPNDYPYVNHIVSHESGWCPTKWQGQVGYCPPYYEPIHSPDSGFGYGLCQSTPAGKMSSAGSDWQTNAVTQLKWCSNYSKRYGGWEGAYNFWLSHRWW